MTPPRAPIIISLNPWHAPVIAAIHGACFDEAPWDETACAAMLTTPGTFGFLASLTPDVQETPNQPVGFVVARMAADEAELLSIAVLKDARRLGAARVLLMQTLAHAQEAGARQMFLEVAVDNVSALALYRACGFEQVGVREKYYARASGRVDALLMRCMLDVHKHT